MRARLTIELTVGDDAKATCVMNALAPDNGPFIDCGYRAGRLRARADAENMRSLLHTLNDFLCCLQLAEKMAETVPKKRRRASVNR
jgi:hypothetical protein